MPVRRDRGVPVTLRDSGKGYMRMRIGVFSDASVDVPDFHVAKPIAAKMLSSGIAIPHRKSAILLVGKLPTPHSPYAMGRLTQGEVYELLGADPHPQVFNGGLTRTEHKPVIIPKFQGARVGSTE